MRKQLGQNILRATQNVALSTNFWCKKSDYGQRPSVLYSRDKYSEILEIKSLENFVHRNVNYERVKEV